MPADARGAPLDDAQQAVVREELTRIIIEDYDADLVKAINRASRLRRDADLSDEVPSLVNDQIRNSLNHLGRASKAQYDLEAQRNFADAKKHLYVAKCLCLASSIETIQESVDAAIIYVHYHKSSIDPAFSRRTRDISREKRKILSEIPWDRGNRSSQTLLDVFPFEKGITRRLRVVLADFMDLYREIRMEYDVPGQKTIRRKNKIKHAMLLTRSHLLVWIIGISTGVIGSIIVYYATKWGYL